MQHAIAQSKSNENVAYVRAQQPNYINKRRKDNGACCTGYSLQFFSSVWFGLALKSAASVTSFVFSLQFFAFCISLQSISFAWAISLLVCANCTIYLLYVPPHGVPGGAEGIHVKSGLRVAGRLAYSLQFETKLKRVACAFLGFTYVLFAQKLLCHSLRKQHACFLMI